MLNQSSFSFEVVKTGQAIFVRDEKIRIAFDADLISRHPDRKHPSDKVGIILLTSLNE